MSEGTEETTLTAEVILAAQVERLREELQRKDEELEELKELRTADARAGVEREDHVETLKKQLEQTELRSELTMLRSLENVRVEHQRAVEREAERVAVWVDELLRSHTAERLTCWRR